MVKCLSICVLLLVGCAAFQEKWRMADFEDVSSAYEQAIRWGNYEVAEGFTKVEEADQKGSNLDKFKKIRVTSYELLNTSTSEDKLRVRQSVKINYYDTDHLIERSIIDKQVWGYDETEESWYLQSGLPDFK